MEHRVMFSASLLGLLVTCVACAAVDEGAPVVPGDPGSRKPQAPDAPEAPPSRIDRAERLAFDAAKRIDTVVSYAVFLKRYPELPIDRRYGIDREANRLRAEASSRIGQLALAHAMSTDSIPEIEKFLAEWTGERTDGVARRLEVLMFKWASDEASIEAYDRYDQLFTRYPQVETSDAMRRREEVMFKKACAINTKKGYSEFLSRSGLGPNRATAKRRLMSLRLKHAQQRGTIEAYEEFTARYPLAVLSEAKDRKILQEALSLFLMRVEHVGSLDAYQRFLKRCPTGALAQRARAKFFESAKAENSLSAYQAFLKSAPDGILADRARAKFFERAKTENSLIAYQAFLKFVPDGILADKARSLTKPLYLARAKSKKSVKEYRLFLSRFPKAVEVGGIRVSLQKQLARNTNAMRIAAMRGDIETVLELLWDGADARSEAGARALVYTLFWAADEAPKAKTMALGGVGEYFSKIHIKQKHTKKWHNCLAAVKQLLGAGADPNAFRLGGTSALGLAERMQAGLGGKTESNSPRIADFVTALKNARAKK
jgi:hypothetical protein